MGAPKETKERLEFGVPPVAGMEIVNVGVIGCGYWGPNLVRNFAENNKFNVVAVSDLRPERLTHIHKTYPEIQLTQDYHDLFDMGLDAVAIATPPPTHYAIGLDALNNGLHALIEKPMTLKSDEARDLIRVAKEQDRVLMVGHAFEFNVAVQTLKDMIDNGDLGDLYYIDSARLNLGLYQKGLNVLWDLAPHDLSILCYLLGQEPVSVRAQGTSCISKGIYDVIYMNLKFNNNLLAHVHVSWLDPYKVRRFTVVGSKKMVVYNDVENEKIKIIDKGVGVTPQMDTASFSEFQYSYRNGDILIPYIHFVEPLRLETQHFYDCITQHKTPKTSGEDGLRVVKILEAAQRSLESGSKEAEI